MSSVRAIAFLLPVLLSTTLAEAETNSEILEKVWKIAGAEACTQDMRSRFDSASLAKLQSQLLHETDRDDLARVLNPFLFSLGWSHTQFLTDTMESYYFLKGCMGIVAPSIRPAPKIVSPGVQVGYDSRGYYIAEVLDGFPAAISDLRKGDRILTVNGEAFRGRWENVSHFDPVVRVLRQGIRKDIWTKFESLNWAQAFQDATSNSIKFLSYKDKKIGYVRLWSGAHPESVASLWRAVDNFHQAEVDGVILDLRGGYGGAFWEHLDPFFLNRDDFFEMVTTDGSGNTSVQTPDPQINAHAYRGPMVVLMNEGTRSGKEALAYQFKKSKRATLIGEKTAGYFAMGKMIFVDQNLDYVLYLCTRSAKLDDVTIEGVGIAPDIQIPFDDQNIWQDSQIQAGLENF